MTTYRDVVDEHDRIIGRATKEELAERGLICRVAFIMLLNSEGKLLLQQRRATKKAYPLYWSGTAAGHLISGETYEHGAHRELEEEVGVQTELHFLGRYLSVEDREMVGVFYGWHDGPFTLERQEVERADFFSIEAIHAEAAKGEMKMTSFLTRGLEMLESALASD